MTREEEISLRDDISRLKRRVSILERKLELPSEDMAIAGPAEILLNPMETINMVFEWK